MEKGRFDVKKFLIPVIIILIVLAGVGYFAYYKLSEKNVSNKIKNLYELANPGTTIEIIDIKSRSGVYKVLMRGTDITGTNYKEVYVTKDGRLLTENVIFVEESIEQIQKMKNFIDCLYDKGVRIYGLNNQTATLLQINTLGMYSPKLYVSCDNRLQACTNIGLQQLPSVVYNNTAYPGVYTIQWFETITGCKVG